MNQASSLHPLLSVPSDRYWGKSSPYDTLTAQNLTFLTVNQAIEDYKVSQGLTVIDSSRSHFHAVDLLELLLTQALLFSILLRTLTFRGLAAAYKAPLA